MKLSRGSVILALIPIVILAALAAAGWYFYFEEIDKYKSLTLNTSSETSLLTNRMSVLQANIDELESESDRLSKQIESELQARQELADLLEQTNADKASIETRMQQEVNQVIMTTAELEAELEKRRATQESLNQTISAVSGEKTELQLRLEQERQDRQQIADLKNRLEQELSETRVEFTQLKNQMTVIELTSDVLFNSGSAEIKPAGQKLLSIIAESLNAYPNRAISVEGHTDDVPLKPGNRYASNWELSAARALAAVDFFQKNSQVDPGRLQLVGYGQYHPTDSNDSAEGRSRNRRIEIRLLPTEFTAID